MLRATQSPVFMDYQSHEFSANSMPQAAYLEENANFADVLPAQYLFDLSLGYNTGDRPANEYLKQINVYLTVNNIFNRHPPFAYGGTATALDHYTNGASSISHHNTVSTDEYGALALPNSGDGLRRLVGNWFTSGRGT